MDEMRSAWNETADRLSGVGLKLKLHDMRQVGQSLTEALRTTFGEVSGEVRGALKQRRDSDPLSTP